jgi:hypothetical protein
MARVSDLGWKVVTPLGEIHRLAESDAIHWIGAPLPPLLPDNDQTRQTINANAVQNFNTTTGIAEGLGGNGVRVGVFDFGIDETHGDFGTRVVQNDNGMNWHGTHVAGVIAGDGRLSAGSDSWLRTNNGTSFLWRGIAPQSALIDADANNAFLAASMSAYIQASGMDISNHSYSYSNDGEYNALGDGFHDQLIRGDATNDGSPIAARAHVYATGNRGDIPRLGGEQVGYFSLSKQSKNGIMVGGYDPQTNQIHPTSSLGPAHDGRIKPDVVAPGHNVHSTGYCALSNDPQLQCVNAPNNETSRRGFYHSVTGSSDAAAAVTGMLALVLQQFHITYSSVNPNWILWPSTVRALTIQTARDIAGPVWYQNADGPVQAFPGPDFATGYGMVDTKAAVDLVAGGRFAQDFVTSACNSRSWWMHSDGASELRVTLAWDDFPASSDALPYTDPKLVNDLDLELIDPSSSAVSYPWLLDQRIVDANGNAIADAAQLCDTEINVQRNVMPTPTPNYGGANHPSNVNDPIPPGALQAAVRGKDHLNNAEQVVVSAPAAGWWQIRVVGFKVAQGPQRFSLATSGKPFLYFPVVNPKQFCWFSPRCASLFDRRVCDKAPKICASPPFAVTPGQIDVSFKNPEEAVFIPMDRLCLFLVECPVCAIEARCRELDVSFVQMSVPLTIEVYEATGRRVFSDASNRTTKRVRVPISPDRSYVLAIKSTSRAKLNTKYELRVDAAEQQRSTSNTPLNPR